jgi:hypothetical protein
MRAPFSPNTSAGSPGHSSSRSPSCWQPRPRATRQGQGAHHGRGVPPGRKRERIGTRCGTACSPPARIDGSNTAAARTTPSIARPPASSGINELNRRLVRTTAALLTGPAHSSLATRRSHEILRGAPNKGEPYPWATSRESSARTNCSTPGADSQRLTHRPGGLGRARLVKGLPVRTALGDWARDRAWCPNPAETT